MTKRNWGRHIHEIQEVDKSILQHHPLPEEQEDCFDIERARFLNDLYLKEEMPTSSNRRFSPVSVNGSSETGTIVSHSYTSRSVSSASSWTDDVYEEESAQKVQHLFDAIDALLYEGIELPDECKDLHGECQYWTQTFPHFRVTGSRLNIPEDQMDSKADDKIFLSSPSNDGHHLVAIESPKRESSGNRKSEETLSLMVHGMSLKPQMPLRLTDNSNEICNSISAYEEIIEQHGEYEELIAVDFSDGECCSKLSDESCTQGDSEIQLQQHIMEILIKDTWNDAISHLRPLLAKYVDFTWKGIIEKHNREMVMNKVPDNYTMGELSPVRLPTTHVLNQDYSDLQGLLTISSKTLLNRSFDKSTRTLAQTSAPAAMVGARLNSSSQRPGLIKSGRGKLAPLERLVKTSIPTSIQIHQENWKNPAALPPPPVSPHSWGRHFPLPPIDSGIQTTSMPMASSVQKLKPTCSAIIRMLSGSNNKRGLFRDSNKQRGNSNSIATVPMTISNAKANRLLSAQVDVMRNYPASYAAVSERVKSSSKLNDFRVQPETLSKKRVISFDKSIQETPNKDRLSSGYLYSNNSERRNNR